MPSIVCDEKSDVSLIGVSFYLTGHISFQGFVFVFQHFYMIHQGVDIFLCYLEFTDPCGCVDECFLSTLGISSHYFLEEFFQSFLSLLSFCYSYYTYIGEFVSHIFLSVCLFFLDIKLGVELLGYMVTLCLTL